MDLGHGDPRDPGALPGSKSVCSQRKWVMLRGARTVGLQKQVILL